MIPLDWISDTNLISALTHGVELDIETPCALLHDIARLDVQAGARAAMSADALREYEARFMKVVVHAWPLPLDPVVIAIRDCAKAGLACVRQLSLPG